MSRSLDPHSAYADLLASLDGIVWEADARTFQFTFVSPQAERLLGFPVDAWLGEDFWRRHLHPEDRDAAVAYYVKATRESRVHDFEYRMLAADGRAVWIRDLVTVVVQDGKAHWLRGIMLDVTARRAAETERSEQLRLLEALDRVNRAIQGAREPGELMHGVLTATLEVFGADRAWLGAPCDPSAPEWRCEMEVTKPEFPGAVQLGVPVPVVPEIAAVFRKVTTTAGPVGFGPGEPEPVPRLLVEQFGVRSVLGMVIYPQRCEPYMFGLHQCSYARAWAPWERRLLAEIGGRLTEALGTQQLYRCILAGEGRFRVFVDHATDAFFLHDADGGILDVNHQACASLGRTREELIGARPEEFDIGLSQPEMMGIRARLDAGEMLTFDTVHRRIDGSIFPVEVRIRGFQEGGRRYSVSLARDITERKAAEAALRESHELFRAVVDSTADGVFVKDMEGRYLMLNEACVRLLGRSRQDVLGRTDAELLRPEDVAAAREREVAVMATGREQVFEHEFGIVGDVRSCSSTLAARHDSRGTVVGVVGIVRDVTAAKRFEEQFRQAQKMEAVGRLAGGLAHDFNNLLTIINGCSELIAGDLPADSPHLPLLRDVLGAGQRAGRLTRQLLAFSRKQLLQPCTVDLNERIGELHSLLARMVGEDIELRRELDAGPGLAFVDPGQFEQALVNLVANARDAMPDGGVITIATHDIDVHEGDAPGRTELRPGRYVVVIVGDSGCGMSAETRARVFEPFFTTKEPGRGTGLGLAMVYGFVKQSGGHVELDSEPGRGTSVRIYLPRAAMAGVVPRSAPASAGGPCGREVVLLVEDEDSVRALARTILHAYGCTVLEARDGLEGLRVARNHSGRIDLLVTDLVMPRLGGWRLAETLVRERPGLAVLTLSGYADERVRGGEPVGFPFLQKPFTPRELAVAARQALESRNRGEAAELPAQERHPE